MPLGQSSLVSCPENCNYMVELGQRAGFSLVGVAGSDLKDRKMTPILALLWQLMRAYTLSLLVKLAEGTEGTDVMGYHRARSPVSNKPIISERGIIDWVNGRLAGANKPRRISVGAGFSDFELRNGLLIIDLLEAISPGCVDYSVVNKGLTPEVRYSRVTSNFTSLLSSLLACALPGCGTTPTTTARKRSPLLNTLLLKNQESN